MFCPQCKAEYRPGFARCADCEVDLVEIPSEAPRVQAPPEEYGALLWKGNDPHLYLRLIFWVGRELACYGRPEHPRSAADSHIGFGNYGSEPVAFEIWVSEADLGRAKWLLQSALQAHEEDPPEERDSKTRGAKNVSTQDAIGTCPLCFGEFKTVSSFCPNCGVPLRLGSPDSGEDTGARVLCDLPHPQFAVELRQALQAARISFNNANHSANDVVTGRFYMPTYDVLVLDADFDRATRVLAQVLQHWEFEPSAGFSPTRKRRKTFWPRRAERNQWQLGDLEALLWVGTNLASADSISMALREHQVPHRLDDSEQGMAKIFVHPEDDSGAREIVAQVVDGVPPAEM